MVLVEAAMGVVLTVVGSGNVGAALGLAAVSGPWWGSNGGGCDDVGGGSVGVLEGSLEGSPEPGCRRFLDSFMVVFGTVLLLYQFST